MPTVLYCTVISVLNLKCKRLGGRQCNKNRPSSGNFPRDRAPKTTREIGKQRALRVASLLTACLLGTRIRVSRTVVHNVGVYTRLPDPNQPVYGELASALAHHVIQDQIQQS